MKLSLKSLSFPLPSNEYDSGMVNHIKNLYEIRFGEYSDGDIRLLINQELYLNYMIPLALEILSKDPFIEVDYFEGDLLKAIINVSKDYWARNSDDYYVLKNILVQSVDKIDKLSVSNSIKDDLKVGINEFLNIF